jgi:hypothetical protein
MTAATFGELAGQARGHLEMAAGLPDTALRGESAIEGARVAGRMARTLARYLADIAPYGMAEAVINRHLDESMRAAVDAREALRMAAMSLRAGMGDLGSSEGEAPYPLPAHLSAAAVALSAARDLLQTHFTSDPAGRRSLRSDLSAVITSVPVGRAILAEVAGWSRQLAFLTARMSLASAADPGIPRRVHQGLADGSHGLLTACAAITSGECGSPDTAADIELLRAIPVNVVPRRQQPCGAESPTELGQGITISAGRMRSITWAAQGEAAWSPAMTADSWQWTATGAAVTCHISGHLLRLLGESPGHLAGDPGLASQLEAAAEGALEACSRWRSVAARWYPMTTETQGLTGPGLVDASDLVLRLGRLAFRDAEWTPASIRSAPLRDPSDLAPDVIRFAEVLAAVHHAADALDRVGDADLGAVSAAIHAGRVHVLTRTLPAEYDVPRRYANVVAGDASGLLAAYQAASDATTHMVARLNELAVAAQAPSRILSAARAATRVVRRNGVHGAARDWPSASDRTLNGWATSARPSLGATGQAPPGPAEQELRRLHSFDPVLLLRAKAVDRAARMLIAEAKRGARQPARPRLPHETGSSVRPAKTAVRVAAESFLEGPSPMLPNSATPPVAVSLRSPRAARRQL